MDEVVPGYESLELDIPRPEEEMTIGEVLGAIILWEKKYIVFPGSASRRPPSPPSRRNSPHPIPPLYDNIDDHHSVSPSRSPPLRHLAQPPPLTRSPRGNIMGRPSLRRLVLLLCRLVLPL
jgi:hypothetical protein